jgi:hypothetical protein
MGDFDEKTFLHDTYFIGWRRWRKYEEGARGALLAHETNRRGCSRNWGCERVVSFLGGCEELLPAC